MSVFDKSYVSMVRSANLALQRIINFDTVSEDARPAARLGYFRLRLALWGLAAILGFVQAWANRYELLSSDALPYLDIATAYLHGDWDVAVNSYWSPLYSWLLAAALWIVKPQPYWELSVIRLVNWAIFLYAMICFDFLMREFLRWKRWQAADSLNENQPAPPDWVYVIFGYSLFVWFSIFQIQVASEHPDILLSGFIYLSVGILLRIQRKEANWLTFAAFGLVLGAGYLAKAVMFPLAFVFLSMSLFAFGNFKKAMARVALATIVFLIVAAPFVAAISKSKNRLTFGETGKLNYAWFVNLGWESTGHTTLYWEGEVPETGKPVHPLRKAHGHPVIYEFAEPVGGTYPPWYDPSYWYEGIRPHFELSGQLRRLALNFLGYYEIFFFSAQFGLMVGMLTLYLMSEGRRIGWLARRWILIVPGIVIMALYSLVCVEPRYVDASLVILWLGLFSGVRPSERWPSARLSANLALAFASLIFILSIGSSSSEIVTTARSFIKGENIEAHQHWKMAVRLKEMGVQPSDKLAIIGRGFHAYWARLAGVKIVAELPFRDSFWGADEAARQRAFSVLAKTGAKFFVADNMPVSFSKVGWEKVPDTKYYVYRLPVEVETGQSNGK